VTHADGLNGGAIDLTRGWYAGPSPGNWNLEDNTVVFANSISDISGPAAQTLTSGLPYTTSANRKCSNTTTSRIGLHVLDATMWRTVMSGNSCTNVTTKLTDASTSSLRVCPSASATACECP
jgi:hypothetical protein